MNHLVVDPSYDLFVALPLSLRCPKERFQIATPCSLFSTHISVLPPTNVTSTSSPPLTALYVHYQLLACSSSIYCDGINSVGSILNRQRWPRKPSSCTIKHANIYPLAHFLCVLEQSRYIIKCFHYYFGLKIDIVYSVTIDFVEKTSGSWSDLTSFLFPIIFYYDYQDPRSISNSSRCSLNHL